ncbi:radical SAM protein [Clostridiaceae bacterium]|nr:radical SAM protein [Clostridiaceae bacterium]
MDYELLLINVSRDQGSLSEAFKDSIGQYLIASYVRQRDFKAFVWSGDTRACKRILEREIGGGRTAIAGFYAAADNIRVVGHVIQWLKTMFPRCKTIVGGPQAAGLDYAFFEETGNDFAILGEGEIPVYHLLRALVDGTEDLREVPSLVMRDDRERTLIVNQCEDAVVTDLDSLGYPRAEDSLTGRLRQGEVAGILTGRGCPFQCSFCYEGANAKNVRFRSIQSVMEEIDYIRARNDRLRFISVYDDTFTLSRSRILEFCREIRRRDVLWFCEGHIAFAAGQPELLREMIASGLSCIQFGIESGSKKVLDAYGKHTDFDMIVRAVEQCKRLGIHSVTGNFIIGGAFESEETIEESKRLAGELIRRARGIIELYAVYFAPYPNTRMAREPERFGMEIHEEWERIRLHTMRTPVAATTALSRNALYDIRQDFDEFLREEYQRAARAPRKADVLQGLFHNGKRLNLNPTWERLYLSRPHIAVFLEHLTEEEQRFDRNRYIIRTFEDVKIEDGVLVSDAGVFGGLERDILACATGVYPASEMAERFGVAIGAVEECFCALNERCLVYMAQF